MADLNAPLVAAAFLLLALLPSCVVIARGGVVDRLVALEFAGIVIALILVLMADAFGRPSFMDVALTLALLSFPGVMAFAQTFERWL